MQRSLLIILAALALGTGLASTPPAAASRRARLLIQPTSGPPGAFVIIRGSGFCASKKCSRVRIQIYSALVAKGIRVSSRGTFVRRHVQVPGGTPAGQVGVIASQRLASGKRRQ